jgi:hypothetical protein
MALGGGRVGPLNAVVCSRVRELQEALSAGAMALEISSRNFPRRGDPKAQGSPPRRPGIDP